MENLYRKVPLPQWAAVTHIHPLKDSPYSPQKSLTAGSPSEDPVLTGHSPILTPPVWRRKVSLPVLPATIRSFFALP